MSKQRQASYRFHDLTISVQGEPAVLDALQSRLGQLPPGGDSAATLRFEFRGAGQDRVHSLSRPELPGRPFYVFPEGEAIHIAADDSLYIDYGGYVRTLCRPSEGWCVTSMREPEAEQLWLGTHPLFTIPLVEMLKRRGRYNLHAAALGLGGRCVLFSGNSGAGKSTLSVALLRAGFEFLGDDMVFLDEGDDLTVRAFPETLDVTAETAAFFPELQPLLGQPMRRGWPKHELQPAALMRSDPASSGDAPSRIAWSAEPAAIVLPRIAHRRESTLLPMSRDEAFLELAPNVLLTDSRSTKAQLSVLARLVHAVPSYRLDTGTDFEQTALRIRELLR